MIRATMKLSGTRVKDWRLYGSSTLGELRRDPPPPPQTWLDDGLAI